MNNNKLGYYSLIFVCYEEDVTTDNKRDGKRRKEEVVQIKKNITMQHLKNIACSNLAYTSVIIILITFFRDGQ